MTVLVSTLSSNHRQQAAEFKRYAYLGNGWNPLYRWDGRASTAVTAGITGPSQELDSWQPAPTTAAGNCTVGIHVVRYRYLDADTGYVSNPSEEREITVASGAEELTFTIKTTGVAADMQDTSGTDGKANRIVIEMTVVGGSEFFKAAESAPLDDTDSQTLVVDISDATLETQFLPWPEDGNDVPPIAKNIVSHRERLWLFGQVVHSVGNCDVTTNSSDVGEGSTDPDWSADALGDSTATPAKTSSVQWLFQRSGDAVAYEIDHYDESANKIVLAGTNTYQGVTGTDVSYTIFSRANVIWVSRAGYPEQFSPLEFINGPNGELAGDLTAGIGYASSMLFFSLSGMFRIIWDTDPLVDPVQIPVSTKRGALNQRVVIEVEGRVYSMDKLGWHMWDGVFPKHISAPIDDLKNSIDYDNEANFHACWHPELRAIRWFVTYTGDGTYPNHYVQLDVDTGAWGTGEFKQGISESRLVPTADGPVVYYGDENGYTWIADTGSCDGCSEDYSHLTCTTGTSAVIQVVTNALPAGSDLAGCYAYWVEGDEYALITSSTASTISATFTSAPDVGDTIWVGPIPAKLKTMALSARAGIGKVVKSRYLWVIFEPSDSSRTLNVRVYDDYSSTAKTWATGRNDLPGLTWPATSTADWKVDLAAGRRMVRIPIGAEARATIEVEFEIVEPDTYVKIISVELDTTERERPA